MKSLWFHIHVKCRKTCGKRSQIQAVLIFKVCHHLVLQVYSQFTFNDLKCHEII
jgi:hypothetical protein